VNHGRQGDQYKAGKDDKQHGQVLAGGRSGSGLTGVDGAGFASILHLPETAPLAASE
jgi:hypothetical protein